MTETDIDGLLLKQTAAGIYQTEDKKTFRLQVVDREYTGRKKPKYYLQLLQGGKAEYISGVFETPERDKLSLDIKDRIGVKTYFDMIIQAEGKFIKIQKRRNSLSKS